MKRQRARRQCCAVTLLVAGLAGGCVSTELDGLRQLPVCSVPLEPGSIAGALLQIDVSAPGLFSACNGIVIAPNLVLTAANCVVAPVLEFDFTVPSCATTGAPVEDGSFEHRYSHVVDPTTIVLKSDPVEALDNAVIEIFVSAASSSCMPDLALLHVQPALDAPRVPLRLEAPSPVDEDVIIHGFDVAASMVALREREATVVASTGTAGSDALPPRSLLLSGEACTFEGGAVAARSTSALIGVILQSDRSINCAGGSGTPVALQLAPFREFLLDAASETESQLFSERAPRREQSNIPDCPR